MRVHGGLRLRRPPHLEVQGLQPSVQRHQRHDLRQPQAPDPGLSRCHRHFRERGQGHLRPSARPRPGRAVQDRLRAGAQNARGDRRRSDRDQTGSASWKWMAPISAATPGRRTPRRTGKTVDWPKSKSASGSQWWSPASGTAGRSRSWHPRRARRFRRCARSFCRVLSSTPMRRRAGIGFTPSTRCAGSITRLRSAWTALASIGGVLSRAFAGPRWAAPPISGKYLGFYAREMAWRETTGGRPAGAYMRWRLARRWPVSRVWAGYWQRH